MLKKVLKGHLCAVRPTILIPDLIRVSLDHLLYGKVAVEIHDFNPPGRRLLTGGRRPPSYSRALLTKSPRGHWRNPLRIVAAAII